MLQRYAARPDKKVLTVKRVCELVSSGRLRLSVHGVECALNQDSYARSMYAKAGVPLTSLVSVLETSAVNRQARNQVHLKQERARTRSTLISCGWACG